jgi:hypothetical protein
MTPSTRKANVAIVGKTKAMLAFPPFEKGGQGGFAVDLLTRKAKQIPLDPPFSKGEKS